MKKVIKFIIQIIVLLLLADLCRYCGELTNDGFSYGVLWYIIVTLVFETKIVIIDTDENEKETRKRIY